MHSAIANGYVTFRTKESIMCSTETLKAVPWPAFFRISGLLTLHDWERGLVNNHPQDNWYPENNNWDNKWVCCCLVQWDRHLYRRLSTYEMFWLTQNRREKVPTWMWALSFKLGSQKKCWEPSEKRGAHQLTMGKPRYLSSPVPIYAK